MAAQRRFMTTERIVDTDDFLKEGPVQSMRINRLMTDGVVEAPFGAHFTECVPDYPRDEAFQKQYAAAAKSPDAWAEFRSTWLDLSEADYQAKLRTDGGTA
jgi:glutaconate CoA-transferase subunit A